MILVYSGNTLYRNPTQLRIITPYATNPYYRFRFCRPLHGALCRTRILSNLAEGKILSCGTVISSNGHVQDPVFLGRLPTRQSSSPERNSGNIPVAAGEAQSRHSSSWPEYLWSESSGHSCRESDNGTLPLLSYVFGFPIITVAIQ